jgi:TonB-linked SusC/RagA family outer membrane protein
MKTKITNSAVPLILIMLLCWPAFSGIAAAIALEVSGKITDESGEPLPGVTVVLKGNSSQGTVTDVDGAYRLNLPDGQEDGILVFSFIGYITQEVSINGRTVVDISMKEEITTLQEVVVVGYGTQKKVNLTGAVSTVDSKSLESRPVSNVSQALQGIAPGLNITQSGNLGGSLENRPSINVRGIGTIGQGSSAAPLILIDGMESDINAISPNDIHSISVLKDAAASSIYGSRAPFGVILITTKQGEAGKTVVNVSSNFRSSSPVLLPDMMDSFSFATYMNDGRANTGQGAFFTDERIQRIKDFIDGKITTTIIPRPGQPNLWADGYFEGNDNVDWYDAVYRSAAPSQEHSLSVSGGNQNIRYYIAGNFLDQTGLMKFGGDSFRRYNTTAKITGKLSEKISLIYTARFSREELERPSYMNQTFNQKIGRWPILPFYDNNGYLYDSPSPALSLRDGGRYRKDNDGLTQQLMLQVEPIKGWNIFGNLNYSTEDDFFHRDFQHTFNHDVNGDPYVYSNRSSVREESARINYFSTNIYSEYSKAFGNHNLKIMAGMQSELKKVHFIMAEREGIIVPSLPVLDLTSGTDYNGGLVSPLVAGHDDHWALLGYFGRVNYNYKERYLLEGNLRYDGSSRFRADKRWILSPSVSAGWNVSEESFWKPLQNYVNSLKIRGSYGELSNQNTHNWYPTYTSMPIGTSNGSWLVNGARPNTASAPGLISSTLSWEKVRTWNIGTDLSFLKDRLNISFDYFTRFTDNMIGPAPELPVNLGTAVPKTNNTNLKTSGIELDLAWRDQLQNGLGYSVRFLLSDSKTEITRYPNPTGNLNTYVEGYMTGEIWGYKTIGIAKIQEEMDAHLASLPNGGQNALGSNWKAGDLMFEDVNGDGKISNGSNTAGDHGDLLIIGNNTPRYRASFDLSVNWKGFDLRGFFQGVLKRDYFNDSFYFWGTSSSIWMTGALTEQLNYFRDDPEHPLGLNLDSYYPRPLYNGKNYKVQTDYLQDASYIRLKNLQIGYTIPSFITKKVSIQKFRVYVSGENIWTTSKMAKMFDPETVDGGWNGSVYPLSKVYAFGLNVTF